MGINWGTSLKGLDETGLLFGIRVESVEKAPDLQSVEKVG